MYTLMEVQGNKAILHFDHVGGGLMAKGDSLKGFAIAGADKLKLKDIVAQAHQQGRRVRFWGAPDRPVFWSEMLANGVDLINTDDLDGARKFLLKN